MIWQLEVDTALKGKIESVVTCPVIFSNPSVVTTKEDYPKVSITLIDQKLNDKLKDHNSRLITKTDRFADMTDLPNYYDFHYQIDFWAKRPSDLNVLTGMWMANIPPRSVLYIVGSEGEKYLANMSFLFFNSLDSVNGEDTTFRRCYTYKISVPVANRTITRPLAQTIHVSQNKN